MVLAAARAIITIALALVTSAAAAQSTAGDIQGSVFDGPGKPLPGVTVTITNIDTGGVRETITSADGSFGVPGLAAGVYELQASHQGYATRRQTPVPVYAGRVLTLRLELTVAPDPETITLGDAAPMVEKTRADASSTLDPVAIEHLPVRSRSALELTRFAAGSARQCDTFAATSACSEANRVIVDAADRTGTVPGAGDVSQEAVQSVVVKAHAYPAEYGRTTGALAAVVTRSGSNELRGSAFAFRGNSALSSATAAAAERDLPKGRYAYNELGASLGGPIVDSRHVGFGLYHGRRETEPNTTFLNLPGVVSSDAATRHAIDRLAGLATTWERKRTHDELLVKTEHQVSDAQRLAVQFHYQRLDGIVAGSPALQTARDAAANVEGSASAFSAVAGSVVGSTLFNEARVQVARDRDAAAPIGSGAYAAVRQDGSLVLQMGGGAFTSREATVRRLQFADTVTLTRGAHKLKAGFDLIFDGVSSTMPGSFSGAYAFNALAGFDRGVPLTAGDSYTQAFEGPGTSGRVVEPDVRDYAVFVQDEWRAADDLTVTAGFRYDVQSFGDAEGATLPERDAGNLAPRFGVAWSPVDTLVVRAGYARAYARTPWTLAASAMAHNGVNVQTVTLRGDNGDAVPRFPNRLSTRPVGARPTMVRFEPSFGNASMHQASAGIDWEWMRSTAVSLSYLFARGDDLPRAVDVNVGAASRLISFESTAEARYDGIAVELTRRFSQGHQYRVAYTFGKARDTMPFAGVVVPDSEADRAIAPITAAADARPAPANHDRRHRLVGAFIYDSNRFAERYDGFLQTLFRDWTLSAVYTMLSGVPFSAYVSGDLNGDNNRFNDLAPDTTRNQHRLDGFNSADARLARDIELKGGTRATLTWEVFNLLNGANDTSVNDTLYAVDGPRLRANPLFGQPLDQAGPRQMRIAARFTF